MGLGPVPLPAHMLDSLSYESRMLRQGDYVKSARETHAILNDINKARNNRELRDSLDELLSTVRSNACATIDVENDYEETFGRAPIMVRRRANVNIGFDMP